MDGAIFETFFKIHRGWHADRYVSSVRGWIHVLSIPRNCCDSYRKDSMLKMFAAPTSQYVFAATRLLQLVGILSVCFVRAADHTAAHRRWQLLFFVCFALLGVAVVWSFRMSSSCWISCSTTLALMTVGATFDTRSARQSASFQR